jgi:hypothetical protein
MSMIFVCNFALNGKNNLLSTEAQKNRHSKMSISERMTIVIAFHQSNHRDFKNFYIGLVQRYWSEYFPKTLSYTRFINTMSALIVPMYAYFQTIKGKPTGIAFIDSTSLKVSRNIRIPRHKVFKASAKRGKGTMGWFFGFKLHLLINHNSEILAMKVTAGNENDRTPVIDLCKISLENCMQIKDILEKP